MSCGINLEIPPAHSFERVMLGQGYVSSVRECTSSARMSFYSSKLEDIPSSTFHDFTVMYLIFQEWFFASTLSMQFNKTIP